MCICIDDSGNVSCIARKRCNAAPCTSPLLDIAGNLLDKSRNPCGDSLSASARHSYWCRFYHIYFEYNDSASAFGCVGNTQTEWCSRRTTWNARNCREIPFETFIYLSNRKICLPMTQRLRTLLVPLQVPDDFFFLVQDFVAALNVVAVVMLALILILARFVVTIHIRLIFRQVFWVLSWKYTRRQLMTLCALRWNLI